MYKQVPIPGGKNRMFLQPFLTCIRGLGLVRGFPSMDFLGDFGLGGGAGLDFDKPIGSPSVCVTPSLGEVTSLCCDDTELTDEDGVLLHEGDDTPIRGENLLGDFILNISEGEMMGRVTGVTISAGFGEPSTVSFGISDGVASACLSPTKDTSSSSAMDSLVTATGDVRPEVLLELSLPGDVILLRTSLYKLGLEVVLAVIILISSCACTGAVSIVFIAVEL